jgi:hypothetical protein
MAPSYGIRMSRSPTSGNSSSMYHARIPSRSATAEAAKRIRRLRGMSGEAQASLDGREVHLAPLFQVHQSLDDATQEGALFQYWCVSWR